MRERLPCPKPRNLSFGFFGRVAGEPFLVQRGVALGVFGLVDRIEQEGCGRRAALGGTDDFWVG